MSPQQAYIVAGYRTAVGKAPRGVFRFTRPDDLAAEVIKHLVKSVPALDPSRVDDVIVGNAVPEAEQGLQMGRLISLLALPLNVPGLIVNRYCGSGVETIAMAVGKIAAGMADCIIAGGTESMSMVPTVGWKTVPNYKLATEHPDYYMGMGLTAEAVAQDYKISREDQDQFAYSSHQKALKAIAEGKFKQSIVPITVEETYLDPATGKKKNRSYVVDTDEGPRADTSEETLGKLKPAFKKDGSVTAGNAPGLNDGAASVMVVSEELAQAHGLTPLAEIVDYASGGLAPEWVMMTPVPATQKLLKKMNIEAGDVDLWELNEAFSVQSLAVARELGLDPERVNVNGGAVALGHPIGASGARILVTLLHALRAQDKELGVATLCMGGGNGLALAVRRLG